MKFKLTAKGTVTECREALNTALEKLEGPHKQEHAVVRAAAHYVVEENLDPLYVPWVEMSTILKNASKPAPSEPATSFSIDISIELKELARKEK